MNDLKTALDTALRHSAAQQRRYRVDDPHERLVLQAAAAFRALLEYAELAPHWRSFCARCTPACGEVVVGEDGAEIRARLDRVEVNTPVVGHGATAIRSCSDGNLDKP
jgi:hypothetical protein